jgi:hypothetical protein
MSCPKDDVDELTIRCRDVLFTISADDWARAAPTTKEESDGNQISVVPSADSTGGFAIDLLAPELSDE